MQVPTTKKKEKKITPIEDFVYIYKVLYALDTLPLYIIIGITVLLLNVSFISFISFWMGVLHCTRKADSLLLFCFKIPQEFEYGWYA